MIPNIIHYCWFGGNPLPDDSKRYIDGWSELNPDFEIMKWDESNFPIDFCSYSREAAKMKNWAFVSDVCRLYALSKFGGIYLDTDVELIKPLKPLLDNETFVGYEGDWIGTAVIGAQAGTKWVDTFLEFYKHRHFINSLGKPVRTPNPTLYTRYIDPILQIDEKPRIYPKEVFYPTIREGDILETITQTVSIHHYAASWKKKRSLFDRIVIIKNGLKARYIGN